MGRRTGHPVFCEHCGEEIEGCEGAHGIWMHTDTRREYCDGSELLAMPSLPTADRRVS